MGSTCRDQVATGRSAINVIGLDAAGCQAHGGDAVTGEQPHRLVGQHAICPATVGDDVLVVGQFGELVREFIEGNSNC